MSREGQGPGLTRAGYDRLRRGLFDTLLEAPADDPLARVALARGYASPEEIQAGLEERERLRAGGQDLPLGQVLVRMRVLTAERYLEVHALAARGGHTRVEGAGPGDPAGLSIGRYRLVRPLGRGGMGTVFEAEDPELDRRVAIKVLREPAAGSDSIERLRREASIAARLGHPNIVGVHEVSSAPGPAGQPVHFIVMDCIDGRTLADMMRDGTSSLAERVAILEVVARTVAFAHARGVVHRDLKPGNVLVESTGRVLLCDFGLARAEGFEARLTGSCDVLGTPAYMAPEQVDPGSGEIDARTDVHALGALLYECLTGTLPFRGRTREEIFYRIRFDDPPRPRRIDPSIPADLEAVALHALAKEKSRRTASAEEFAEDLRRWLAGEPVRARPPGAIRRLSNRVRRNPWPWAAGGIVAAAVVAAGLFVVAERARRERERRVDALVEEAGPLHAAAITASLSGDNPTADRLMARFEERLAQARAIDPSFEGGWFERAQYRRLAGDLDGAWEALEEGIERDPGNPLGRIEKGMLLAERYKGALRRALRPIENLPANAPRGGPGSAWLESPAEAERSHPELARLREEAESEIDAGTHEMGLELPSVRLARGELAYLRGDLEAAERLVEGLEYAAAKTLRGRIAEAREDCEAAEDWYTRAIHTHGAHWDAWEARAELRRLLWSRQWEAQGNGGRREIDEAVFDWEEAARGRPECVETLFGLAVARHDRAIHLYYAQEDPRSDVGEAISRAKQIFELDPANLQARRLAVEASKYAVNWEVNAGEDPTRSVERAIDLSEALLASGEDAQIRIQRGYLWFTLSAWCAGHDRDPSAAAARSLAEFDLAVEASPSSPQAHFGRGLALFSLGRWADAAVAFQSSLDHLDDSGNPTREQVESFLESARSGGR
ncbi:MAG: serine/threonine protein kinase [Planctomycetes bacterium]|nr:serine/threonine protein kinase [Planctomycetota bacterium]